MHGVDDWCRGISWKIDRNPSRGVVILEDLIAESRDVRKSCHAFRTGHGERMNATVVIELEVVKKSRD